MSRLRIRLSQPNLAEFGVANELGKKEKIMDKIVATNVIVSRPPNSDRMQRRPLFPIIHFHRCEILAIL